MNLVTVCGHNTTMLYHMLQHYSPIVESFYVNIYANYEDDPIIEEATSICRELGIEPHIDRYTRDGRLRRKTKKEMEDDRNLALQKPIEKESQLYSKMRQVEQSRKVMSMLEIHRLEWLMEVKEAFDSRFNKMIDSMCDNIAPKGGHFDIQVEEVSNSWNEFEVLIHVEETTFHARAIWVNCVDKVSHYRFITTTRKRKL